jgi:hypothetical protein
LRRPSAIAELGRVVELPTSAQLLPDPARVSVSRTRLTEKRTTGLNAGCGCGGSRLHPVHGFTLLRSRGRCYLGFLAHEPIPCTTGFHYIVEADGTVGAKDNWPRDHDILGRGRKHHRARHGVGDVIATARRMVDGVATTARRSTLKGAELTG